MIEKQGRETVLTGAAEGSRLKPGIQGKDYLFVNWKARGEPSIGVLFGRKIMRKEICSLLPGLVLFADRPNRKLTGRRAVR